jgi:hypothetical protein
MAERIHGLNFLGLAIRVVLEVGEVWQVWVVGVNAGAASPGGTRPGNEILFGAERDWRAGPDSFEERDAKYL